MLLQRVLTALLLLPMLLAAIWLLDARGLYGLFSLVGALGAWEWARLAGYQTTRARLRFVALTVTALALAWQLRGHWQWLALASLPAWLWITRWLLRFPGGFANGSPKRWQLGLLGLSFLVAVVASLATLRDRADGVSWVLHLLFVIFAADTGAYFAGRALGRHKLLVAVSPGKTVEGAVGGLALAMLWAMLSAVWLLDLRGGELLALAGLSVAVAAASIIGDLSESMFKRMVGVKDSGNWLPGHGGVLDRIDSLLAAAPVMAIGVWSLSL